MAQASAGTRTVIAAHLVLTLYGHWAVNDPRGSLSASFDDLKFAPLGPIHFGRKAESRQPSKEELREFHRRHGELLNFPVIWMDAATRSEAAAAVAEVIADRGYTCYACAVCSNHLHLLFRTHRDRARQMWEYLAQAIRRRLRHRFSETIQPGHPVISARPYHLLLFSPAQVRRTVRYIDQNPRKEGLPRQRWPFVTEYDGWPMNRSD